MSRFLFLLVLVGCVPSLPTPREPNRAVPSSFGGGPPSAQTTSAAQRTWDELFASPDLRALITTAHEHNQELSIQLQEIVIAATESTAARGEYRPRVDAFAGAGIEKVGEHTPQGVSDEAHDVPIHLTDFSFGLRASWEVDIWKKLRNAAKAADLRYLASVEARNFMVTQIVAEIARSYFELISLDNQLEVLANNVALQTNALEVVKLQKQAARVTELAVRRFEAELLKNRSRLFDLEQQRIQTENRINFLVGRFPQHVARDPSSLRTSAPTPISEGLPAELLANRPDVRQAELELAASKLDVRSARAAFYPSVSIEAGVGYRSFNATHLLATPSSIFFDLAGGLTAPLLNRTAIAAHYRAANARQMQAVLTYERTLLQAFTDVVNGLATVDNLARSYDLQQQQVDALARASETSMILFQSARADYMEVLLTRREALDAEMELIETRKRQLQAMVKIYQALGGGWRTRAR